MAESKKYFFLKLKENFFDTDEMIILESMPDGYLYSNILLKLYLRSLKYDGRLMFNERIPFNSTMLAQVTRHNVGVIEKAMKVYQDLGLVEILDNGAIYMLDIQNFIGKSSTEADRIRDYRKIIENEKGCTNVQHLYDKCTPEIEIELEKEIEIEKEKEIEKEPEQKNGNKNIPLSTIVDAYHSICVSFPKVRTLTENRKKALNARIRTGYTLEDFQRLFEMAENSDFLKGKNKRNWSADFDWLINDANMAKVLEGKYENKERSVDSGSDQGYVPSGKFAKYTGMVL